jgi:hypothetical protein
MLLHWVLADNIVRFTSRVGRMNPQLFNVIGIATRKTSQRQAKARNRSCSWVPARFVSQKGERDLIRFWRIRGYSRHATLSGSHPSPMDLVRHGQLIAKFCAWNFGHWSKCSGRKMHRNAHMPRFQSPHDATG